MSHWESGSGSPHNEVNTQAAGEAICARMGICWHLLVVLLSNLPCPFKGARRHSHPLPTPAYTFLQKTAGTDQPGSSRTLSTSCRQAQPGSCLSYYSRDLRIKSREQYWSCEVSDSLTPATEPLHCKLQCGLAKHLSGTSCLCLIACV